ncbi:MAG: MiaB/RimO family radical SAM methylthiotransferase [Gemmatimonadota bacterium]
MAVHYLTFGCKANQYDSERIRQELEARGLSTTDDVSRANVFVVNTCTVTHQADADARRAIRGLHRRHPDARIVVLGCSAALEADRYREMAGVSFVVEGHDPQIVAAGVLQTPHLVPLTLRSSLDRLDHEPIGADLLRSRRGRTRGWLKVQDGCDRKCAFCATRIARGASRSRAPDEVVREASHLAEHHPELVITGIHIGHYGRDLEPRITLSGLVERLLEQIDGVRFRLGSVEATELDDRMIDLLAGAGDRLVPHVHMPLQSGSDAVLRRMRRWHTREQVRERVLSLAERTRWLGLGADVITGFPGESERDHADTRALVDELPYTYLHVFPFSARRGTAAWDLPDPVPKELAADRARELRELAQAKGAEYRTRRIGTTAAVVVEGAQAGLTEDYLRVRVEGWRPVAGADGAGGVLTGTLRGSAADLYIHAASGALVPA